MTVLFTSFVIAISSLYFSQMHDEFDVVVLKYDGDKMFDVRVSFEGFQEFRFGNIQARASEMGSSIFATHEGNWPSQIIVEWSEGSRQGQRFSQPIDIAPPLALRRGEDLQLVIEFQDNSVLAYPRARKRIDHRPNYRYE